MTSPESTDSPQVKLVRSAIEGIRKRDVAYLAKHLHEDHRRITYPRSLGKPEQTKEEWFQHTSEVMSLCTEAEPTIHSIIEAPGKVVLHCTSIAKTTIGVDMVREMIFIAHVVPDEDGNLKIKTLEEFTDSKSYLDFFQAAAEARASNYAA